MLSNKTRAMRPKGQAVTLQGVEQLFYFIQCGWIKCVTTVLQLSSAEILKSFFNETDVVWVPENSTSDQQVMCKS